MIGVIWGTYLQRLSHFLVPNSFSSPYCNQTHYTEFDKQIMIIVWTNVINDQQ